MDKDRQQEMFKYFLQWKVAHQTETFKSLITISTSAFKSLQLLNGGAVIVMLTYLGHIESASFNAIHGFRVPLIQYLLGVLLATAVYIPSYYTQLMLHNENMNYMTQLLNEDSSGPIKETHGYYLFATLALCVGSLASFCLGSYSTIQAIMFAATSN